MQKEKLKLISNHHSPSYALTLPASSRFMLAIAEFATSSGMAESTIFLIGIPLSIFYDCKLFDFSFYGNNIYPIEIYTGNVVQNGYNGKSM